MALYKVGDLVRVSNYGQRWWKWNEGSNNVLEIDIHPEYIGIEGIVVNVAEDQGMAKYVVDAPITPMWFYEDQLDIITVF